ncbi:2-oxoglutarate dehydrogenase, E2 component, dihydrolipoamide succinyltransferase [Microbacterium sp. STN6]|uniref:2-oxoglutarate dehydrogenase, E2 component, dihydrolipoamide succinyltransferase n=1 Tax=Microbacterium sp. STN6 TaxID=2995588 RepID=UPI0022608AB1|nr:2-oxoglutarate dehydrogenase, E2 component, dihydrolipoamide succinyltransferase [Microbacterium sp. STN6]MCX7522425.1 2-oxoglutarate dehydrogenase, E2 component, dihydrolipoamide succinyltransferase [Microbacterium sp. STN6]
MSESVSLPALGESVTEGTVTRWLKNVGDRVEVDEPLLEVSTDKVDTEIPSPISGVLEEILVQEDETVDVGSVLARIGDGSGAGQEGSAPAQESAAEQAPEPQAAEQQAPEQQAPEQQQAPVAEPQSAEVPSTEAPAQPATEAPAAEAPATPPAPAAAAPAPASPAEPQVQQQTQQEEQQQAPREAAALAPQQSEQWAPPAPPQQPSESAPAQAEAAQPAASQPDAQQPAAPRGPSHSSGTGYVTPIVRKLANEQGVDLASITGTGVGGRIRKEDILSASAASAPAAQAAHAPEAEVSPLRGTTQPMSRLRKVVAERAVASMQASAQLTTVVEVDVTAVAALRDRVKEQFREKTGAKLSFLPFFTLAAAEALKTYPVINATIDGDSIVYPDHENVCMAVDTERGLLTPVIRDASSLTIADLATEIADLAERTRDNRLKPDELSGGTFTVTNTGSRGALFDTPVVFLPQVAILGTGVVTKRPAIVSVDGTDAIAVRSTVYLALSYDHRIVDGADAARFLGAVKTRLEQAAFEENLGI